MVCAGEFFVRVGGADCDHRHACGPGRFYAGGSVLDHQAVGPRHVEDLGRDAYQALRPLARWSDTWASALGEDSEKPIP